MHAFSQIAIEVQIYFVNQNQQTRRFFATHFSEEYNQNCLKVVCTSILIQRAFKKLTDVRHLSMHIDSYIRSLSAASYVPVLDNLYQILYEPCSFPTGVHSTNEMHSGYHTHAQKHTHRHTHSTRQRIQSRKMQINKVQR